MITVTQSIWRMLLSERQRYLLVLLIRNTGGNDKCDVVHSVDRCLPHKLLLA